MFSRLRLSKLTSDKSNVNEEYPCDKDRRTYLDRVFRWLNLLRKKVGILTLNKLPLLKSILWTLVLSMSLCLFVFWLQNESLISFQNRCLSSVSYRKFVVSSDAEECSLIGCNILKSGGNAIDAAIATAICTTVVNPHSTSLSGGAFLLYHSSDGKSKFFNLREAAGSNVRPELYDNGTINKQHGAGSVCVANLARGFYDIWKKYGKFSWNKLVEPSVIVARDGFTVGSSLSSAIETMRDKLDGYKRLSSFLRNPTTGKYLKAGDIYKDELYAKTLALIAKNITFVEKELHILLRDELCVFFDEEYPGIGCPVTLKDFEEYRGVEQSVLETSLLNKKLIFGNLTSSGIMVQFILKLLSLQNIRPFEKTDVESYSNYIHLLTETYKWAYSKRAGLGDHFGANDVELLDKSIKFYLNDSEIRRISKDKITEETHDMEYYEPTGQSESSHGTSHLSVIDGEGNAVALTTSVNYYLGSLIRSPSTGIILNNAMDDFTITRGSNYYGLKGSVSNLIGQKRQPLSSMSPVILLDEDRKVELTIGGSGGSHIPTAVAGVMSNYIFRGLSLKDAINDPRTHHQLDPDTIYNDELYPLDKRVAYKLKKKGHNFLSSPFYSAVQGALRKGSLLYGEADPRKNGFAYGV